MHARYSTLVVLAIFAVFHSCASASSTDENPSKTGSPTVAGSDAFHFEKDAMGTRFRIVLFTPEGHEFARDAARAAFDRIDLLEARASDWRSDSELSELSRWASLDASIEEGYSLSPELSRLFVLCEEMRERSGGRFDPAIGANTKRGRRALRQGVWPDANVSDRSHWARAPLWKMRGRRMIMNHEADRNATSFDLGAVAKGAGLDAALTELEARGIQSAMIEGGGDLLCGEPPPGAKGWRIEMAPGSSFAIDPPGHLSVVQAAVATSGSHSRGGEVGEVFRSHLFRADSGEALGESGERVAACVIVSREGRADAGARADALATVLCLLDERGRANLMCDSTDLEARTWTRREGESALTQSSEEFDSWQASRSTARAPKLEPAPSPSSTPSPQ